MTPTSSFERSTEVELLVEIGAIPEKVDAEGRPVSVAPLSWTDAIVLLALVARDGSLPVPPIPAP